MRCLPFRFASLVFLLVLAVPAQALQTRVLFEQTLAVALNGEEVGTMTARDQQTSDGFILERENDLRLTRGATRTTLRTKAIVRLGPDRKPLSYHFERADPSGTLSSDGVVQGDTLVLTTTQNGARVTNRVALPPGATFALAVENEVRMAPRDGLSQERAVILEELGAVVQLKTSVRKLNKTPPTFLVTSSFSGMSTEEEIDAKGSTLMSRTPSVNMVAYPVGRAPAHVGAGKADLLAVSTWETKAVPSPAARVRYRITTADAAAFAVPEDARQKVTKRTGTYVEIEVDDRKTVGRTSASNVDAATLARLRQATPYEAIEDKRISSTAAQVVQGAKSDRDKIALLNNFVYRLVEKKSLDRGYAPAVTTLEAKAGDCTEHSVLLSALLRSLGFATRIADGVIVDGTHAGYHEWIEVFVPGEGFVAADPTFNAFPAGAERLKLAQGSTMPDEQLQLSLAAARLLRNGVKVEVLSAEGR